MSKKSKIKANPVSNHTRFHLKHAAQKFQSRQAFLNEIKKYYNGDIKITAKKGTKWDESTEEGSFLQCLQVLAYGGTCRGTKYKPSQSLQKALFRVGQEEIISEDVNRMLQKHTTVSTRSLNDAQRLALGFISARTITDKKVLEQYFLLIDKDMPKGKKIADLQSIIDKLQFQTSSETILQRARKFSGGKKLADDIVKELNEQHEALKKLLIIEKRKEDRLRQVGGVDKITPESTGLSTGEKIGVGVTVAGAVVGGAYLRNKYEENKRLEKESKEIIDELNKNKITDNDINNNIQNEDKDKSSCKYEELKTKINNMDFNTLSIEYYTEYVKLIPIRTTIDSKLKEKIGNLLTNVVDFSVDTTYKMSCLEKALANSEEKTFDDFKDKVLEIYKVKIKNSKNNVDKAILIWRYFHVYFLEKSSKNADNIAKSILTKTFLTQFIESLNDSYLNEHLDFTSALDSIYRNTDNIPNNDIKELSSSSSSSSSSSLLSSSGSVLNHESSGEKLEEEEDSVNSASEGAVLTSGEKLEEKLDPVDSASGTASAEHLLDATERTDATTELTDATN